MMVHSPPVVSDGLERMNQGSTSTRDEPIISPSNNLNSSDSMSMIDEGPQGYQF